MKEQSKYLTDKWFQKVDGEIRLMGSTCAKCKKISFPQKPICPECASYDVSPVPLSKEGTLHTFALTHLGPSDIEGPYVIGFVDIPEGIKLYTLINVDRPYEDNLKIGMKMEMVIEAIKQDEEGSDLIAYKFRPFSGEIS